MKPLVIAATTLALAGTAYAQTEPAPQPVMPVEQTEDAAAAAEQAADQAEQAADQAADETGAAAGMAADKAADAAAMSEDAAAEAAADAEAAQTGMGADGMGADGMGTEGADMAEDAADDAAAAADDAGDAAADAAEEAAAEEPVVAPDVNAPAISEAEPGVLSSWVTSRRIWTTNQPSTTEWVDPAVEERPAEWQDIAKVNDIVMDDSGQVLGYVADIGGFLGIGAKKVLLGQDAIHLVTVAEETFFATNYTKAELEALPDFDEKTVRQ